MTLLLALSSLISRILGIYPNALLANMFGASELSDAYFAAFEVPDLLYRLFIFGAISATFVPLFLQLRRKDAKEAWEFASSIINAGLLIMLVFSIVVFFSSDWLIALLYPAFSVSAKAVTAKLLRIMMISPIFFTISSVYSSVQNALRTFWGFALAPIVYNLGIIFGIWYLAPIYGIEGVAYGVVLGAFLHALVQLLPMINLGFVWKPKIVLTDAFKKLLLVSLPRIFSMMGNQINFFIEGLIAISVSTGALTMYRYAQDMQSFPVGVFGVSMAISSFSIVADYILDDRLSHLAEYLKTKMGHLLFVLVPSVVGMYCLRYLLVRLLLGGGSFDATAVETTARILQALCLGIIPAALIPLLTRLYFSFHNTVWPFLVTLISVIFNTILAYLVTKTFGIVGMGFSSALSSLIMFLLLFIKAKMQYFPKKPLLPGKDTALFSIAALLMGLALQLVMEQVSFASARLLLFPQILLLVAFGGLVYGIVCLIIFRKRFWELVRGIMD